MAGFNEMLGEIKKRDAQLRQHSQELEQQVAARTENLRTLNHELAAAHAEIGLFLECIPSILIGLDAAGHITRWNLTAAQTFSLSAEQVEGKTLDQCGIRWLHRNMTTELAEWLKSATIRQCDDLAYENEGEVHFVGFSVRRIYSKDSETTRFIVTGADVTQKKNLEEQLRQAHKLEAIGQLAAGIAHEINTPTQYIGDNTTFLKESWQQILKVLELCRGMHREGAGQGSVSQPSLADFDRLCEECDLTFLLREIPRAIDESLNGLQQVAKIVRAMKEFSHSGSEEKEPFDLNSAVAATITVARSEWKHVAEVEFVPDPELPVAQGLAGELKQVILNLIVNAAHAIGDVVGDGARGKGKITVTTRRAGDWVEVAVSDTGAGIPEKIRSRVFELFFTTG
jgi:PAS domain S-box-containing protein